MGGGCGGGYTCVSSAFATDASDWLGFAGISVSPFGQHVCGISICLFFFLSFMVPGMM
jgi:hypothetical protein